MSVTSIVQYTVLIVLHNVLVKVFTKVKHVVPALAEDVPGFGEQLVEPLWHGHGEQGHHKHGVDAANEAFGFFRNNLIQAPDSGLKQHRGDACREMKGWKKKTKATLTS